VKDPARFIAHAVVLSLSPDGKKVADARARLSELLRDPRRTWPRDMAGVVAAVKDALFAGAVEPVPDDARARIRAALADWFGARVAAAAQYGP